MMEITTLLQGNCAFICAILVAAVGVTVTSTVEDHTRLHENLFKNYKMFLRPVKNQSAALQINISFFIIMIHDLDLKNQVLTTNAWLRISWYDQFLTWNKNEYGGLNEVLVSVDEVWTPDLLVENTAYGYKELGIKEMKINLDSNGQLIWEPGIVMQTICEVSITKYPFDKQHCSLRVMSWMHTNKMITVHVERNKVDTTGYYPNGEWDITETEVRLYSPEDGSYNSGEILPGAEAVIQLRRKPIFYILSTILPIAMLSVLNLLVFLLPCNTGEKMTLAVTVLLSFTVFMSLVNEIMPKTSNSISILGSITFIIILLLMFKFTNMRLSDLRTLAVYLTFLLTLSGISVASTVWVLYLYHKDACPKWARRWEEVHDSKYYRVTKSPKPTSFATTSMSNNNFNINDISASVSQRLLLEPEVDLSDREESESEAMSWMSKKCCCGTRCWTGKPCSCACGCLNFKLSKKLDTILLWVVGSLTCTANLVIFAMLTSD